MKHINLVNSKNGSLRKEVPFLEKALFCRFNFFYKVPG